MRVLCTGPEASGTRLLSRAVATRADTVHRSMPHGNNWWEPDLGQFGCHRAVVIVRDRLITARSADNAGHARTVEQGLERRDRAIGILSQLPDALWVSYEGIFPNPDGWLSVISGWLGVDLEWPERVVDGNEKWRPS